MMLKFKRLCSAILIIALILGSLTMIFANAQEFENPQPVDAVQPDESTETMYDDYCCNGCVIDDLDDYVDVSESENINTTYSKKDIAPLSADGLPSSVDNSASPYFPYIFKQGLLGYDINKRQIGCCASAAVGHYQLTYTLNKARGIETTRDNTFSPKWIYHIVNVDEGGSRFSETYKFLQSSGCSSSNSVPYVGFDCRNWCFDPAIWREAMDNRITDYVYYDGLYGKLGTAATQISSPDDPDLLRIKTALANEEILAVATYYYSHVQAKIKAHPDASENIKYEGERYVSHCNGKEGGHAMVVVGYNDDIWCDINNNDEIDEGEMGAFKVANSGDYNYANRGFIWVAYDALNEHSVVKGGENPEGRATSLYNFYGMKVSADADKEPQIYAKFTLNTADRTQFAVDFTADDGVNQYKNSFLPGIDYYNNNEPIAFDTTTTACNATFAYSLKNVVPELNGDNFDSYNFNITVSDSKADDKPLIVKNVTIVNEYTGEEYVINNKFPVTVNGSKYTAPISTNTTSICYIGYDKPILHYKVGNGEFTEVAMKESDAERGYEYIYVLENSSDDVTLYFSDENGKIDDNNGEYYTAGKGVNYYYTKNQRDKLVINDFNVTNDVNAFDLSKQLFFDIDASGGYGPYGYIYTIENLDTGDKRVYDYYHTFHGQDCFMKSGGRHRITVEVIDRANETATMTKEFDFEDRTFRIDSVTLSKPNGVVSKPMVFESITAYESFVENKKPVTYFIVRDRRGVDLLNKAVISTSYSVSDSTSTTQLTYIPTKAGEYELFVYSVDGKSIRDEKIIPFNVYDMLYGDANGDGIISVMDATIIQLYLAQIISPDDFYLSMANSDSDNDITIVDVTYIQMYLAQKDNCANVGEIIE